MKESRSENAKESILDDFIAEIGVEFGQWFKKHPDTTSGSGFENRCALVKEGVDFEFFEVSAREAVYWFDNLPEALYTSADGDEQYDDLQHYINNLEDFGESSLFVKLEKFVSQTNIETPEEKEALDSMKQSNKQSEMCKPLWAKWSIGDTVTKTKGSSWTGKVVGYYQTDLTSKGYAVESSTEKGSVQIYPEAALCDMETPQQREERERLEAAYDLYVTAQESLNVIGYESFQQFADDKVQVKFWLAIVDKTNYRKEG